MSEALGDDLGMHAGLKRDRRVSVAQIVQSDERQSGSSNEFREPLRDSSGIQGRTVLVTEYQLAVRSYLAMFRKDIGG